MKHSDVQIVDINNNNRNKKIVWIIVMTILIAISAFMAFAATWRGYLPYGFYYFLPAAAVGAVFGIIVHIFKEQISWIRVILIIPMLSVFIPAGFKGGFNGARIWIDVMIYSWNTMHDGGLGLLSVAGGSRDIIAFVILVSVIIGELAFWFASTNSLIQCEMYILFWLFIQLISGNINVLSCGLLIACGIIMAACGKTFYITLRSIIMSAAILVMFVMATGLGTDKIKSIINIRTYIREQINDIRYGEEKLLEGNVREAAKLKEADEDMLTVWSEQEKNIYLKGYVGVTYDTETGVWNKLSDSAYGGDNYGMLQWLYKNSFNPLTQSAQYNSLSERQDKPEINSLVITINNASRNHVYVPSSVDTFIHGKAKNNKDMNYAGRGIAGSRQYEVSEISGSRPAELMIAEEWLAQPDSQEQQNYVNTEAVYRNFVYDNYTTETKEYYNLMNRMFWDDYEAETEGIYGAVSRVREVLKSSFVFKEDIQEAPDSDDPLEWYITDSHEGNAVVYASTAVMALRAYGIPARYVEGYYVSASDLEKSADGQVTLTGENAHAWVEVYFDGIGWQPIDVTPGYYYEAAALQQMVNSPDKVHKTATLDDDKNSETGKIIDDKNNESRISEEIAAKVWNTGIIILGIIACIIIVVAAVIAVLHVIYVIAGVCHREKYKRSSTAEKAEMLRKYIYQLLKVKGIEAVLGWNTQETDKAVSERFNNIESGEYTRVCVLLEKVMYGNIELEGYELRTLEIFTKEIVGDYSRDNWHTRMKSAFVIFKI